MDFAIALDTIGHLTKLCRTAIGEYSLENAKSIDEWALFLDKD
jgi:tRNA U55 pseudouridine synthase TruB